MCVCIMMLVTITKTNPKDINKTVCFSDFILITFSPNCSAYLYLSLSLSLYIYIYIYMYLYIYIYIYILTPPPPSGW